MQQVIRQNNRDGVKEMHRELLTSKNRKNRQDKDRRKIGIGIYAVI